MGNNTSVVDIIEKDMVNKEFILLRFFEEKEHIETFRSGKIRMMSVRYYKQIEKCKSKLYDNRYDILENSAFIYNPDKDGTIHLIEPFKIENNKYIKMRVTPNCLWGPVIIANNTLDEITKIFCLYSLIKEDIVDGNLSSYLSTMEDTLGKYYCLITNTTEFLFRVKNGILRYKNVQKNIRNGQLGFVKYINENSFSGRYGAFHKPHGLSWQKEFRIKLETTDNDPFWLNIDCLKDITIWGKMSDLLNGKISKDGNLIINNYYS